jgi:hypothetical protein
MRTYPSKPVGIREPTLQLGPRMRRTIQAAAATSLLHVMRLVPTFCQVPQLRDTTCGETTAALYTTPPSSDAACAVPNHLVDFLLVQ